jgi:hypothetical protein
MRILFAVRKENEDWQEELITEDEAKIDAASVWARENGFDRLRVAEIEDGKPDFGKTVRL